MKSHIKIYGPPVLDAIMALEKVSVDLPEVCIMDKLIERDYAGFNDPEYVRGYWEETLNALIDVKRCGTIISKSEESIGENDFVFEWFAEPTLDQLKALIKQVDDALAPLDVRYTITTK